MPGLDQVTCDYGYVTVNARCHSHSPQRIRRDIRAHLVWRRVLILDAAPTDQHGHGRPGMVNGQLTKSPPD
jgi:hypothetical protein